MLFRSPVARDMASSVVDDGLFWLEEPVWPPEDTGGLASVREIGVPIAAGENVGDGLFLNGGRGGVASRRHGSEHLVGQAEIGKGH